MVSGQKLSCQKLLSKNLLGQNIWSLVENENKKIIIRLEIKINESNCVQLVEKITVSHSKQQVEKAQVVTARTRQGSTENFWSLYFSGRLYSVCVN